MLGTSTSNVTVDYNGATTQTTNQTLNNKKVKFHINNNGGGKRLVKSNNISMTFTFSNPVKASEIAFYIEDLDGNIAGGSPEGNYTFKINNNQPNGILQAELVNGNNTNFNANYNSSTGVYTFQSSTNDQYLLLKGYGDTLVTTFTITSTGVGGSDAVAYSLLAYKTCDTNNNGIPNYLDTDSDNDGCPDAIEGAGNVLEKNLKSNKTINSSVDANGVPSLVNSGQAIGSAANAAINACICTKSSNTSGIALSTNVGISTVTKDEDWPQKIKGSHLALESKSKGLVISRISKTADLNNILEPKEGMIVFDLEANCLKIYSKDMNATSNSWKCFNVQTCPDN